MNTPKLPSKPALRPLLTFMFVMLMTSAIVLAYLNVAKYEPDYEVVNPQVHYATQFAPDQLAVGREFRIKRSNEFTITRELIRCVGGKLEVNMEKGTPNCGNGILLRASLERSDDVPYLASPNIQRAHRIHSIPRLDPGIYQLLNRVCWPANIIKQECLTLPILEVEIFRDYSASPMRQSWR